MAEGGRGGRPLSPKTVLRVHRVIRKAIGDAERKGILQRNVARLADKPSTAQLDTERPAWTPEELRTFLTAAEGDELFALYRPAALTGMRRGELCGLRWEDVNLTDQTVRVRQSLAVTDGVPKVSTPKSRRSRRVIDIDDRTTDILRTHADQQRQAAEFVGMGGSKPATCSRPSSAPRTTPTTSPSDSWRSSAPSTSPTSPSTASATPTPPTCSPWARTREWSANASDTPTSPSPCRSTATSSPATNERPPRRQRVSSTCDACASRLGQTERVESFDSFPGFAISGYRSITGDPQWIPIEDEVTVILGANNSGKSNVLRLLHLHMADLFKTIRSTASNSTIEGFNERVDAPRDAKSTVRLHWPLDVARLESSGHRQDLLRALLDDPALRAFGVPALPLEGPDLKSGLGVTAESALRLETEASNIPWAQLSADLAKASGGGRGQNAGRVLTWLRQHALEPPPTAFVPPSRSIRSGSATSEWDFGGEGVIDRLHRIRNPEFDEDDLREQGISLTRDLRTLLEDDGLEFEVTHDQATLNVRIGGQFYPLSSLGTGTEHAVLILAARHVFPDHLLCLEEPDAHLHPRLQRRMMRLLRERGRRRIVVATHSAHLIDVDVDTVVAVRHNGARSSLTPVGDPDLYAELRALGYRASDLLQANSIVWVEGPSDRIYLLHWIAAVAPDLVEGVDFSIMFYGGALLNRLTAAPEGEEDPSLVNLWRMNQRMWLVMDSDLGEGELKPPVQRLRDEIAAAGRGGVWITEGYTIENYVPNDMLERAAKATHPSVVRLKSPAKNRDPLVRLARTNGSFLKTVDKVGIAVAVTEHDAQLDHLDLREQIDRLVTFLRAESPTLESVATERSGPDVTTV